MRCCCCCVNMCIWIRSEYTHIDTLCNLCERTQPNNQPIRIFMRNTQWNPKEIPTKLKRKSSENIISALLLPLLLLLLLFFITGSFAFNWAKNYRWIPQAYVFFSINFVYFERLGSKRIWNSIMKMSAHADRNLHRNRYLSMIQVASSELRAASGLRGFCTIKIANEFDRSEIKNSCKFIEKKVAESSTHSNLLRRFFFLSLNCLHKLHFNLSKYWPCYFFSSSFNDYLKSRKNASLITICIE